MGITMKSPKVISRAAEHRVSPHSIEAEQALLGSILIDKDSINKAIEILSSDGSDFYSDVHAEIFRNMVALFEKHEPADVVTLTNVFKNVAMLDSVGGVSYFGVLSEVTPTAASITYYAKIVREKSLLRKLISAATGIVEKGYEAEDDVEEFVDDAEKIIFQVSQERAKKSYYPLKDLVKSTYEMLEKFIDKGSVITGVPTGFKDIDALTSGLQPSDLIIIAGRPSMGKTAFALNIAEYAAAEGNSPVAIFSLEMSKEQLTQRMLASRARVDLHKLRNGRLADEEWVKINRAVGSLYEAPIYIDDSAAQTVLEVRAKARRWKAELGLKFIVVDYLQLMRGRGGRIDSREQEVSDISRSLKALAKELNIPVVALSQLSRKAEDRSITGNRPQLSDLRESGAIEQDADIVMFVYREGYYKPCDCAKGQCSCGRMRTAEILVRKHRNGPTDDVKLTFIHEYARFEDQSQQNYDDIHGSWVE